MTMPRDPRFDRKVELAAIAGGGLWTVGTFACFAAGNVRAGYMMLMLGTVVGTSLALVRTATEPDEELELREEIGTELRP